MNVKDKVIITITGDQGEVVQVGSGEVLVKHRATIDGQIMEVLQLYTSSVCQLIEEEIVVKRGILSEDKAQTITFDNGSKVVAIKTDEENIRSKIKKIEFGIIPDDIIAEEPKRRKGKK